MISFSLGQLTVVWGRKSEVSFYLKILINKNTILKNSVIITCLKVSLSFVSYDFACVIDDDDDDDDDEDNDDDDSFVVWLTNVKCSALFWAKNIVRDPHHCESLRRRKQDLNLCRTWI